MAYFDPTDSSGQGNPNVTPGYQNPWTNQWQAAPAVIPPGLTANPGAAYDPTQGYTGPPTGAFLDANGNPTWGANPPGSPGANAAIADTQAQVQAAMNQSNGGGGGTGGGGGGGGTGGGGAYSSAGFQWPQFTAPAWQAPTPYVAPAPFQEPAPFSYQDFSAPTMDQARQEPGFAFALGEGQKALQNSAAAKGTLLSGGAEKALAGWTNQFADQNYGNVFNRASQIYNTNRSNAADIYNTNRNNAAQDYLNNYNIGANAWNMNAQQQDLANQYNFNAAAAQFNPQFQAAQLTFADLFNRQQLQNQTLTSIANNPNAA